MSDSLEEINAHRATLGLPPISADVDSNGEEVEEPIDEDQQAYDNYQKHKEEQAQAAKKKEILDRIEKSKNRKKQHEKLKGKGLADEDDGDEADALAWIRKSRQREKQLAEQRAKVLADMDEEVQQQQQYKASDLRGLKVAHDITDFEEGQETILTLKDRGILDDLDGNDDDDTGMDELTNVNMEDRERLLKNLENKKKKPGYNPYDDDEFLLGQDEKPSLLPHYDEDKKRSEGFVLGKQGSISTASVAATRAKHQANQPQLSVAEKLKQVQTLDYNKTQGIKDYYTQDEINLTFKKPKKLKKKKKIRQRSTMADDGDVQESTPIDTTVDQQQEEEPPKAPYQPAADANFVDDDDLQEALSRSRRDANRQKKKLLKRMTPEDIARAIVEERENQAEQQGAEDDNDGDNDGGLVLSETTEFLNSVGNVPIYVREQRQNMAAAAAAAAATLPTSDDDTNQDDNSGSKQTTITDMDEDQSMTPPQTTTDEHVKEDEPVYDEPLVGRGLAATLNLLTQKGLMAKATPAQLARDKLVSEQLKWQAESKKREQQLKRQIDQRNKGTGERDRHREYDAEKQKEREERDRLREHERRMADYKPDVYLEYVDDQGHVLKTKEAFRYQSHKFHGKTSGKGKTEKRLQKLDEEKKLNMMSSTDTPLNLAGALLERQQRTGNAHVVLSVGNRGAVPSEGSGIKRSLDQNTNSPNKKR